MSVTLHVRIHGRVFPIVLTREQRARLLADIERSFLMGDRDLSAPEPRGILHTVEVKTS